MWDLPGPGLKPVSPCIGRQILNHCTTREVPQLHFNFPFTLQRTQIGWKWKDGKRHRANSNWELECSLLISENSDFGTSLAVQWLRICLPRQGTRVWALVREDATCHRATKPVHHNYWACALEPVSHNYWAHVPQLLKPVSLESVLHNKRSRCNEKPAHRNEE